MCGTSDLHRLDSNLVRSVQAAMQAAFKNFYTWEGEKNSSRHYTKRLFCELRCLAEKRGVDIRLTWKEPQNWEFLYDVCFLVTDNIKDQSGYFTSEAPLKRVLFVLECEWNSNNKEILYDFSKLLMARSKLRSLVFYKSSEEGFKSIIQDIKSAINAFEQGEQSDRYLICGLVPQCLRFVLLDGEGNELKCL